MQVYMMIWEINNEINKKIKKYGIVIQTPSISLGLQANLSQINYCSITKMYLK